jgi:hypothetical protein
MLQMDSNTGITRPTTKRHKCTRNLSRIAGKHLVIYMGIHKMFTSMSKQKNARRATFYLPVLAITCALEIGLAMKIRLAMCN